jgi:hypothetical protein
MSDDQPTTGAGSSADEPMQMIPTDLESVVNYCLGTLDCVATLCAALIGYGVMPPNSFQADFKRWADLHAQNGNTMRREPLVYLIARLREMERLSVGVKQDVAAHLVNPSSISTTKN